MRRRPASSSLLALAAGIVLLSTAAPGFAADNGAAAVAFVMSHDDERTDTRAPGLQLFGAPDLPSTAVSLVSCANREVQELASTPLQPPARAAVRPSSSKSSAYSWNHRHPILFGALIGAAGGCAIAAAAWGAEGAWVGTFGGAAAGAIVGAIVAH